MGQAVVMLEKFARKDFVTTTIYSVVICNAIRRSM
jgi:hypothetical protein